MYRTPAERAWYREDADQVFVLTGGGRQGLTAAEAQERLRQVGPNRLAEARVVSPWHILISQFDSFIVKLLVVAALVSALLGETVDSLAILAIVVLNALIGFFQEYRAERALAALKAMTAPKAKVRRDNRMQVVDAGEVVPGDLVILEAGDLVPADGRLITAAALTTVEAALTGESLPITKSAETLTESDLPLGDRLNLVFMGTSVAAGSGEVLVVATGMQTEIGKIAGLISEEKQSTPLQKRLQSLGQVLVWAALGIVGVIFALGLINQIPLFELFLTAVSLSVAAVPEGLPAVVTVALAVGVQRMAHRRALIRRLASVETLGATTVIATDKTGTLTVGQMTVRDLWVAGRSLPVTGEGYAPSGAIQGASDDAQQVARILALSSNARLVEKEGQWQVIGDPTEGALVALAHKAGLDADLFDQTHLREREFPFDSERQRMSWVRRRPEGELVLYLKGAPEVVLPRCSHWLTEAGVVPLGEADRQSILAANHGMASRALRVLAAAWRPLDGLPEGEEVETGLVFAGLAGMHDPPREEARASVARCLEAGIRVVMITGDHPETARAIAREIGLLAESDEVLSGRDLEAMSDERLQERVSHVRVYARVTAAHKLKIVKAWQAQGAVVAMTGDGVNDAPAIKAADVGIAMGMTGTDVTKEASDMVVADDNFASIVAAVEEGRGVYDNIQKTLLYLLAGNTGELLFIMLCLLMLLPLPLMPVHLLWINLMTDGLPALALATDPKDPDAMRRPPRGREEAMLSRVFWGWMLLAGLLTAGVTLTVYTWAMQQFSYGVAMTMAFATLVYAELFKSFAMRHLAKPLLQVGIFSNLKLLAVVGVSLAMQPWLYASDWLSHIFKTVPLSWEQLWPVMAAGLIPFLVLEGVKLVRR